MKIVYRNFALAAMLLSALCLAACGGGASGEQDAPAEPVTIAELRLECAAPNGGADFPAAARAFGTALQTALAEEGITAETLSVSFARADAVTAQALSEGGVTLGVLSPLSALRQEGSELLALLTREGEGAQAVIAAASSAYGAQLAARAEGSSALTAAEWSRAAVGAVEGDDALYAALDYALAESAGSGLSQLPLWQTYESEAALLAAMDADKVDAALLRGSAAGDRAVLLHGGTVYDAAFALSTAAELPEDAVTEAVAAALKTAQGQALLRQYSCDGFVAAEKETVETLRRLAEWEDTQ